MGFALPRWALVGAVSVAVVMVAALACGGISTETSEDSLGQATDLEGSSAPADPDQLAVQEAYTRLAQAMARPGQVFHTRVTTLQQLGPTTTDVWLITDIWVDLGQEVARRELRLAPNLDAPVADKTHIVVDGSFTYLLVGGGLFQRPVEICPGTASALLSLVVDCYRVGPYNEPFVYRTEPEATFEGTDAVLIVIQSPRPTRSPLPPQPGRPTPAQGENSIDNWLYLDRETYLPLGRLAGPAQGGRPPDRPLLSTYENEFIAADSLPADFFDPATLDPVDPSPVFSEG